MHISAGTQDSQAAADQATETDHVLQLPDEILRQVFGRLDLGSLAGITCTCKRFLGVADTTLWADVCAAEAGRRSPAGGRTVAAHRRLTVAHKQQISRSWKDVFYLFESLAKDPRMRQEREEGIYANVDFARTTSCAQYQHAPGLPQLNSGTLVTDLDKAVVYDNDSGHLVTAWCTHFSADAPDLQGLVSFVADRGVDRVIIQGTAMDQIQSNDNLAHLPCQLAPHEAKAFMRLLGRDSRLPDRARKECASLARSECAAFEACCQPISDICFWGLQDGEFNRVSAENAFALAVSPGKGRWSQQVDLSGLDLEWSTGTVTACAAPGLATFVAPREGTGKECLAALAGEPCSDTQDPPIALTYLDLSHFRPLAAADGCRGLTRAVLRRHPSLQVLKLAGCNVEAILGQPGPAGGRDALPVSLQHLTSLDLTGATELSPATLATLLMHCHHLRTLSCGECTSVAAQGGPAAVLTSLGTSEAKAVRNLYVTTPKCRAEGTTRPSSSQVAPASSGQQPPAAEHLTSATQAQLSLENMPWPNQASCSELSDTCVPDAACGRLEDIPLPSLRHLEVGWGTGGALLLLLCMRSEFLASLTLGLGAGITDRALVQVARLCPHLQALTLRMANVSDEGMHAVLTSCRQLSTLQLLQCSGPFSDATTEGLAHRRPIQRLHDLRIVGGAERLTDVGLARLLDTHQAALQRLELVRCRSLTPACLPALQAHSPTLEHLRLQDCGGPTRLPPAHAWTAPLEKLVCSCERLRFAMLRHTGPLLPGFAERVDAASPLLERLVVDACDLPPSARWGPRREPFLRTFPQDCPSLHFVEVVECSSPSPTEALASTPDAAIAGAGVYKHHVTAPATVYLKKRVRNVGTWLTKRPYREEDWQMSNW